MDVFSTELGIQLSFVKTSKFRGGGVEPSPQTPPLCSPLCVCCVGSGLCEELITGSEESYRVYVRACARAELCVI
jgi:hypothetical protein